MSAVRGSSGKQAALRALGHASWLLAALAIAAHLTLATSAAIVSSVSEAVLAGLGLLVLFGYALAFLCGLLALILGLAAGLAAGRWPAILGLLLSLGAGGFAALRGLQAGIETVSREEKVFASADGLTKITLKGGWSDAHELNERASLEVAWPLRELYLLVISEPKPDAGTRLRLAEYSQAEVDSMIAELSDHRLGSTREVAIDGFPGLQTEIDGRIADVAISYRLSVVETPRHVHTIIAWTLASRIGRNAAELERIIQSLELTDLARDLRSGELNPANLGALCRSEAATFLCVKSQGDGRLGRGRSDHFYTEADGQFAVEHPSVGLKAVFSGGDRWQIELGPPMDEVLTTGLYQGTTAEPHSRTRQEGSDEVWQRPLLRARFPAGRCGDPAGQFLIHVLEVSADGWVERLGFDFELLCRGDKGTQMGRFCFHCPESLRGSSPGLPFKPSIDDHRAMLRTIAAPGPKIRFETLDDYCATEAATFLCTFSQRGDNAGWTTFGPVTDGEVRWERPKSPDGLGFRYRQDSDKTLRLYFNPPAGEPLKEGTYTVDWTAARGLSSPGLYLAGSTHCSKVRGRFRVFERDRRARSFGVDFEQYCGSTSHAALIGRFCQNCTRPKP